MCPLKAFLFSLALHVEGLKKPTCLHQGQAKKAQNYQAGDFEVCLNCTVIDANTQRVPEGKQVL